MARRIALNGNNVKTANQKAARKGGKKSERVKEKKLLSQKSLAGESNNGVGSKKKRTCSLGKKGVLITGIDVQPMGYGGH